MSLLHAIGALLLAFMHSVFFWPLFELATVLLVWFVLIRPALKSYRYTTGILDELDAATRPMWSRLLLQLKGIWSAAIGMAAALFASLPTLLDQLTGIHWEAFFDPATVSKIIAGIALVAAVVHVWEMKGAAAIVPKDPPAQ